MSVKVKICGITSLPAALAATEAGADLIGLMFYERSPRCLSLDQAAEIAREAYATGKTIREIALAGGIFSAGELDALLDPWKMAGAPQGPGAPSPHPLPRSRGRGEG